MCVYMCAHVCVWAMGGWDRLAFQQRKKTQAENKAAWGSMALLGATDLELLKHKM